MAARGCELPADLVPLILEAIDNWWSRDLAALSTLSSTWSFYVSKKLYAYPVLQTFSAIRLLARTLSASPLLPSLVKGLYLQPTGGTQCRRPSSEELSGLRILLGLEGLRRLTLGGELSVKADRFLRLILSPETVEELHIDGSLLSNNLTCRPSFEWDESLAFGFASLSKLRLTATELDINPRSIPYPSTIQYLVLEHVHIISGYLPQLFIGSESLERLQILTNDSADMMRQLDLTLACCAVRCLMYETQKDDASNFIPDMSSSSAEALRCLHIKGLSVDASLLSLLRNKCRNLVELHVSGRGVRVSPREWAEFIELGALPSLRVVGLPLGTNYPPFSVWTESARNEIAEACGRRGIAIM